MYQILSESTWFCDGRYDKNILVFFSVHSVVQMYRIPLCSNLNLRNIRENVDNDSRMQLLTLLKNPFITNLMFVISVYTAQRGANTKLVTL